MVSALRMGEHRSRSPRTREGTEGPARDTLPRRRSGLPDPIITPSDPVAPVTENDAIPKAKRSPLPRRRRVPYDPLNPTEPRLTIFTEDRFPELPTLASRPATSPISSRDNSPRSRSPIALPSIFTYTLFTTITRPQTSSSHQETSCHSTYYLHTDSYFARSYRTRWFFLIFTCCFGRCYSFCYCFKASTYNHTWLYCTEIYSDYIQGCFQAYASQANFWDSCHIQGIIISTFQDRCHQCFELRIHLCYSFLKRWVIIEWQKAFERSSQIAPLVLTTKSIPDLKDLDTLLLQARALISKACDNNSTPVQFQKYIQSVGLSVFHPRSCSDERPFKCLCIFGPPRIGKSGAAGGMNACIKGTQVSTTSKNFTNMSTRRHYCNDTFSNQDGMNYEKLCQCVNSVMYCSPGRHFLVIEGHRIFESEQVMDFSNYVVVLTGIPYTLKNRKVPTPETSLRLYQGRACPHLEQINSSKFILKLDARRAAESMVKKIGTGTFIITKDLGLPEAGRYLSDTKYLLDTSAKPLRRPPSWRSCILLHPMPFAFEPTCIPMHLPDITWLACFAVKPIFSWVLMLCLKSRLSPRSVFMSDVRTLFCNDGVFIRILRFNHTIYLSILSYPRMSYHGPRDNGEGRVTNDEHDWDGDPHTTNIPSVPIPTPLRLAWGWSTPNTTEESEVTSPGNPSIIDLLRRPRDRIERLPFDWTAILWGTRVATYLAELTLSWSLHTINSKNPISERLAEFAANRDDPIDDVWTPPGLLPGFLCGKKQGLFSANSLLLHLVLLWVVALNFQWFLNPFDYVFLYLFIRLKFVWRFVQVVSFCFSVGRRVSRPSPSKDCPLPPQDRPPKVIHRAYHHIKRKV